MLSIADAILNLLGEGIFVNFLVASFGLLLLDLGFWVMLDIASAVLYFCEWGISLAVVNFGLKWLDWGLWRMLDVASTVLNLVDWGLWQVLGFTCIGPNSSAWGPLLARDILSICLCLRNYRLWLQVSCVGLCLLGRGLPLALEVATVCWHLLHWGISRVLEVYFLLLRTASSDFNLLESCPLIKRRFIGAIVGLFSRLELWRLWVCYKGRLILTRRNLELALAFWGPNKLTLLICLFSLGGSCRVHVRGIAHRVLAYMPLGRPRIRVREGPGDILRVFDGDTILWNSELDLVVAFLSGGDVRCRLDRAQGLRSIEHIFCHKNILISWLFTKSKTLSRYPLSSLDEVVMLDFQGAL